MMEDARTPDMDGSAPEQTSLLSPRPPLDASHMTVEAPSDPTAPDRPHTDRHADFVLLGGGMASAAAAATLRSEGAEGSILLISAETIPPYHHPALSKRVLLGEKPSGQAFIHPDGFYEEQRIDLALGTRVVTVNSREKIITTAAGGTISYGQLLVATGGTPKPLRAPGAHLQGVFTLRDMNDASSIRAAMEQAHHAVVLGGSFLGMEIAMALLEAGLQVTIIEQGPVLLRHLEAIRLSEYFRAYAESRGARVMLNDTVREVHGQAGQPEEEKGRVKAVETTSGVHIPCDLLVVSIGVSPATSFLEGSDIELSNGYVMVDSLLRASTPGVFAAGDVTTFYDPIFARQRHIEHWDNALKQGRIAARNMLGRRMPYDEVSYFFCEVGDIGFNVLGAPEDADHWVERGSLDEGNYALFYLKGDVPRALFSVGRPVDETRVAEGLIRYRVGLGDTLSRLREPDFVLDQIPPQTAVLLQGGGAMGAFECGVVKALEEEGIFPDIVAGVSIGALNGAIIAAHPRHATEALESFWADLTVNTPPMMADDMRRLIAAGRVLTLGVPNFFSPRWIVPPLTPDLWPIHWNSFYDTAPMRRLLNSYVDFGALKKSPVRLLVNAVDVTTARQTVFDSYVDDLTADHIIASGSLPPGFPWTEIEGKAYWDGGIISNSPLDMVLERCGPDGKRVFIVDLFSGQRALPDNMAEVLTRRDEIVYSERVQNDLYHREKVDTYRRLIGFLTSRLDEDEQARIKRLPVYIQLMGQSAAGSITRFVREGRPGEHATKDYDFSDVAICANQAEGYAAVKKALAQK
ncbi:MAG: FAD-dependent oxidoreductase [Xanthobacter sp.]